MRQLGLLPLAAWYGALVAFNAFLDALQDEQVAGPTNSSSRAWSPNSILFPAISMPRFKRKIATVDPQLFHTFSMNCLNNSLYNSQCP
jgi:hypothetical protein